MPIAPHRRKWRPLVAACAFSFFALQVPTAKAFTWPWSNLERTPPPVRELSPKPAKEARVIVVDPGHGGIDGGTSGGGLLEKTMTLDIALRVRTALQQAGYIVQMTRDTDKDVSLLFPSRLSGRHKRDLQNRLDLIRQSRAVGAVSIHINSSTQPADRGPIVFYALHSETGKSLATRVQAAVNAVSGSTQRPLGRTNLFILRHAPCPTVLVEVGFVTNQDDVMRMNTPQYRQRIAVAIASSMVEDLRTAPIPPVFHKHAALADWTPPVP